MSLKISAGKFEDFKSTALKELNVSDSLATHLGQLLDRAFHMGVESTESLENDCMIRHHWFPKGSAVKALVEFAEKEYRNEVAAQNSEIQFGTDDNEHWFAHDVPYFGLVQISKFIENGCEEWDIILNDCWQGPFNSKSECISHLMDCIKEHRDEESLKDAAT